MYESVGRLVLYVYYVLILSMYEIVGRLVLYVYYVLILSILDHVRECR